MVNKTGIIKYDMTTKSRRIPMMKDCKYNDHWEKCKSLRKKIRNIIRQNKKRDSIQIYAAIYTRD